MKKKPVIIAMVVLLLCLVGGWFMFFGSYKLKGERFIDSRWDKTENYFDLDNIGNYEDVFFQIYHKIVLIFQSDANTLIATYTPEEYEKQVKKLQEEVPFLEGEKESVYGDFEMNGWHFEVCDFEESRFPKSFSMVAFHEETNRIAYVEFKDPDLDTISGEKDGETMIYFVDHYINCKKFQ